jgi:predicted metal-dependent phosphotriesterase family hydrolase
MSGIVRTVSGDVEPAALGVCDAHEHLLLVSPLLPDDPLDDVAAASRDAHALAAAGVEAVVEWTPVGLGRDVRGLELLSRESGLRLVASTGLHRDAHYPPDHWARGESAEALCELFVGELLAGVDGTAIRAGAIKCGAGYHRLTAFEQTVLAAAAAAHARTGAPVCVHTETGTLGPELLELLGSHGVPAASIVLAHLDRNPDPGLHRELAAAGAWLAYDRPGRIKYGPDSEVLDLIESVGPDRILLGGDHARRNEHPIDYVFRRFVPRLDPDDARQILVRNPARAFAWEPRA